MFAVTWRCPAPACREACRIVNTPTAAGWVHTVDGSPVCGAPERVEVAAHKAGWSGRAWRTEEARAAMRLEASADASRIVTDMPVHCGECKAALRVSITAGIERAWEAAHSWSQTEYLREHPVGALVTAH
jgi:hypothetical protein